MNIHVDVNRWNKKTKTLEMNNTPVLLLLHHIITNFVTFVHPRPESTHTVQLCVTWGNKNHTCNMKHDRKIKYILSTDTQRHWQLNQWMNEQMNKKLSICLWQHGLVIGPCDGCLRVSLHIPLKPPYVETPPLTTWGCVNLTCWRPLVAAGSPVEYPSWLTGPPTNKLLGLGSHITRTRLPVGQSARPLDLVYQQGNPKGTTTGKIYFDQIVILGDVTFCLDMFRLLL